MSGDAQTHGPAPLPTMGLSTLPEFLGPLSYPQWENQVWTKSSHSVVCPVSGVETERQTWGQTELEIDNERMTTEMEKEGEMEQETELWMKR